MAELNIIKELGLDALPEDRKLKLAQRITELLMKRLALRILMSLNDEDRKTADDLMQSGKDEEVLEFFKVRVPDFENMLNEEMGKLRQEMKDELLKK